MKLSRNALLGLAAAATITLGAVEDVRAQEKLTMVIFAPPSLGALLPPLHAHTDNPDL